MRNVFDQYTASENRLTHAFATVLKLDRNIRADFLKRYLNLDRKSFAYSLSVTSQSYPGEPSISEEEAEQRGIPDIWMFDDDLEWCAVVECKITAALKGEQINRHISTARRRGFENEVIPVTITVSPPVVELPQGTTCIVWSELYTWLREQSTISEWAGLAAQYFEILESQMVENGQLQEGTLTTFTGFGFSNEGVYSYPEAKRLLRLALAELRKNKKLVGAIEVDPSLPSRSAITGRDSDFVWDYLQLSYANKSDSHTFHLHLTLGVHASHVEAMVTLPNNIQGNVRKRLADLGLDGFLKILRQLLDNWKVVQKAEPYAVPTLRMIQRRYPSQRSEPFIDTLMSADIRTGFVDSAPVKHQPEWIHAAYSAFRNKKSNLQMQVGLVFPYDRCLKIGTRQALELIANTWIGSRPLIDLVYSM